MDNVINKADDLLNFVTQDKEVLREYHLREMAILDWNTSVYTATEKGIEKGAMQSKIEIAKNLLGEGITIQIIQKTTGLDIEKIKTL